MSTSTLEQIDWATCMDDEPGCNFPRVSCQEVARFVVRVACGCCVTACDAHKRHIVLHIAKGIHGRRAFYCPLCNSHDWTGALLEDLVTVVPL